MRIVSAALPRDMSHVTLFGVTCHVFRVSVVVRRTTTLTRNVGGFAASPPAAPPAEPASPPGLAAVTLAACFLEDSRQAPRRRRRRRGAPPPLFEPRLDSWQRGADNPHDVVFWRIRGPKLSPGGFYLGVSHFVRADEVHQVACACRKHKLVRGWIETCDIFQDYLVVNKISYTARVFSIHKRGKNDPGWSTSMPGPASNLPSAVLDRGCREMRFLSSEVLPATWRAWRMSGCSP